MGPQRPRAVVLDSGALIAFERNDRRVRRLVELAAEHKRVLHVPSDVVAQVWRNGARQVRLARLIGSDTLEIQNLDLDEAKAVGVMCGSAGTADVVDASVALLARRHRAPVVTSDPADIAQFGADIECILC